MVTEPPIANEKGLRPYGRSEVYSDKRDARFLRGIHMGFTDPAAVSAAITIPPTGVSW